MTGDNPIERAFALARSGQCSDLKELERQLKREGFTNVLQHLSGPSIRRQITDLMSGRPQPIEE